MSLRDFWKPENWRLQEEVVEDEEEEPDHIHQWEEKRTTYTEPQSANLGADTETYKKISMGTTNILEQCLICHDLRQTEMLGTDQPPLNQLLGHALNYGPQYIQRDGITFVIAQYQQPQPQGSGIPIR